MTENTGTNSGPFIGTARFKLLREIGAGGMGIVFEAEDRDRSSRVALKTLHQLNPTDLYRFKKEFRCLQSLVHPNLVTLYEFIAEEGHWFLTMELVDGQDFLSYVRGHAADPSAAATSPRLHTDPQSNNQTICLDDSATLELGSGTSQPASLPTTLLREDLTRSGASWRLALGMEDTNELGFSLGEKSPVTPPPGDLPTVSPDDPACDLHRLRAVLGQFADGLNYLHESGMLHRDLKPSNVLVTSADRVVILDFGLITEFPARPTAERRPSTERASQTPLLPDPVNALAQTDRGLIVGTVRYMAPEQAAGGPLTRAADWYSFGVILYQALTGELPFTGTAAEVIEKKRTSPVVPPITRRSGVPEELSELCVRLLDSDPKARPPYSEIRARLSPGGEVPTAQVPRPRLPTDLPFVGREHELSRLRQSYQHVQGGGSAVILLRGRSGNGKTSLIQRFLDRELAQERCAVLAGRCFEQESVPFKAVDNLVDSLSRYLVSLPAETLRGLVPRDVGPLTRMFPVLRLVDTIAARASREGLPPDPLELRRRAFAALRQLLFELGRSCPLVLWIDDLQWGDLDSALLLAEVLRSPAMPHLLLLASYRSEYEDVNPCLKSIAHPERFLGGDVHLERIDVGPLAKGDAETLAAILLDQSGGTETDRSALVARDSAGNPYLIAEIARYIEARSQTDHGGSAGEASIGVPDMVWFRIQRLPEESRRLLELVAVAGRPISQAQAYPPTGLDARDRAPLLHLRNERLLRSGGPGIDDEIEVYHDQIREWLLERLPVETRCEHHRRLAESLEAGGRADPETLAFHFASGDQPSRAARYYRQAALQANRALAFDRAASLYSLALELSAWPPETEGRIKAELGDALANSRRGREAGFVYLDAAARVPAAQSIEFRRRAFQQLLTSGEHDLGIDQLRQVFREVGLRYPTTPGRALLSAATGLTRFRLRGLGFRPQPLYAIDQAQLLKLDVGWSAGMSLCLIDSARAAAIFVQNLEDSLRAGDLLRTTRPLLAVASLFAVRGTGHLGRYTQLLRQSEQWMARGDDPHLQALYYMVRGLAAYAQGQWKLALELNDRSTALFRDHCTGVTMSVELNALYALRSLCWLGEFAELRRRRRALLKEAEDRQDLFAMTNFRTKVMTFDLLADDDSDLAAHEIGDAMSRWSQRGFHAQHLFALIASTRVDLYRGAGTSARERIAKDWVRYRRSQLHRSCIGRVNINQLIASSALASWQAHSKTASLAREAMAAVKRLKRERIPYASALGLMYRGRLASLEGDNKAAVEFYTPAASQFQSLDMPVHAAAVWFRLGEALGGQERQELLDKAIDWLRSRRVANPAAMIRMILP
jgi:serine/threonine protein kinase